MLLSSSTAVLFSNVYGIYFYLVAEKLLNMQMKTKLLYNIWCIIME